MLASLPSQDDKPAGRQEALINGKMFKHIVAQGFYQMFWMFLFLYGLPQFLPQYAVYTDEDFTRVASVLFNTFIFAQIFNLVNSRRINDEYNIFEGESDCRLCQCQVLVTCAAAWWGGLRGGGGQRQIWDLRT